MSAALLIRVRFTSDTYRGADQGQTEPIPSPARLHAAFVAAAAAGPAASANGRVTRAEDHDAEAISWLEQHEPLGMLIPDVRLARCPVARHRVRVAVDVHERRDLHRNETDFEPLSALAGPVVYAWPQAPSPICVSLQTLAREITHVGRADSTVVITVSTGEFDPAAPGAVALAKGRGSGLELRIPEAGRLSALVNAHNRATSPGRQRHGPGQRSKQAQDQPVDSAGDAATVLRRFVRRNATGPWPYAQAWTVPVTPELPGWSVKPANRVRTAVSVHRALVAAIGNDVPNFVTGRDGAGPLTGLGHLAIQFVERDCSGPELVLGVPDGVADADLAALLKAFAASPALRIGKQVIRLGAPTVTSAVSFWSRPAKTFATSVPLVLDAPGTPRHGAWTLDDSVLCSVGYALRGALEARGVDWGVGWSFRRELVAQLKMLGVDARAFRVPRAAARFAHRGREGDLLVACHATVKLGELDETGRGLLALGRSRHLGGGLLMPLAGER